MAATNPYGWATPLAQKYIRQNLEEAARNPGVPNPGQVSPAKPPPAQPPAARPGSGTEYAQGLLTRPKTGAANPRPVAPAQEFNTSPGWQSDAQRTILDEWRGTPGIGDMGKYSDASWRDRTAAYANNYMVPMFNASMAERTQGFNESSFAANFGETQRLNSHQMGLASRADAREQQGLDFSIGKWGIEFDEGKRQFDQATAVDKMWKTGQLSNQQYANESERLAVNNRMVIETAQNKIADYEARTGRIDVEGRQRLQQYANQTERMDVTNRNLIAQEQNKIANYEAQTGRIDVQGRQRLQEYANQTERQGVQGQLSFQNRQLSMDDAYRYRQLSQEAALTRERMDSDLMQTRYSVFGRAQAPNVRQMASWR